MSTAKEMFTAPAKLCVGLEALRAQEKSKVVKRENINHSEHREHRDEK